MANERHVVLRVNHIGQGSIEIDGQFVRNVRAVSVESRVGDLTRVTIEFTNVSVEVDADGLVDVTAMSSNGTRHRVPWA